MDQCFILDGMLGSLARWLRILGYDTLYYVDRDDDELRAEALKTGRILVTRDSELVQRSIKNGTPALLIESAETLKQLREITDVYNLDVIPKNTRCPRCNGLLEPVEKTTLKEIVPEESYNVFDEFWRCVECEAVYWRGSHWVQILESLERLQGSNIL
ncbi:MAG: Mut7-C RNAse domain-containing protein [Candidatus Bathyarchaeota archaeon]|nr:Mut7-C RNAse domain-containing protein [Candidatus Bathyarchaeota archaeon]